MTYVSITHSLNLFVYLAKGILNFIRFLNRWILIWSRNFGIPSGFQHMLITNQWVRQACTRESERQTTQVIHIKFGKHRLFASKVLQKRGAEKNINKNHGLIRLSECELLAIGNICDYIRSIYSCAATPA